MKRVMRPTTLRRLNQLHQSIENCVVCDVNRGFKNYPFRKSYRWIPERIKIMFIAEDPPPSGKYIYDGTNEKFTLGILKLMKEAGLISTMRLEEFTRNGLYLTDVVKCPKGKVNHCVRFLVEEIKILNPDFICTLGKKALSAFLKQKDFKLSDYAGRFIPTNEIKPELNFGIPIFSCYFPLKYPVKMSIKGKHLKKLAHRVM